MIYPIASLLLKIYCYIYYMGKIKKQLEEITTFQQFGTDFEFMYKNKIQNRSLDELVFDIDYFNN